MTRTTAGPILVAAFAVIWIGVSVIALSVQEASPTMKRRVAIGVTVFLCFVLILWWLEQSLTVQAAAPLPQLHFWIAVFFSKMAALVGPLFFTELLVCSCHRDNSSAKRRVICNVT